MATLGPRRFRQEAQAFSQYCEQRLKRTPSSREPPDCTNLLDEILQDQTLITGFVTPDSDDFNQSALVARLGSLFGSYVYVDQQKKEHPAPIVNPSAVQFKPFAAGKTDVMLRFALPGLYVPFTQSAFLDSLSQCLHAGPSDEAVFIQTSIDADARRTAPGRLAHLITQATSAAFMVPLSGVARADEVVPKDKDIYARQPVNGDGACLYRAIAVSLLYSLTGVLFDHTVAFSSGILDNKKDGWQSENYSVNRKRSIDDDENRHRLLIALSVNILTLWIKFYTYVVACTAIPINRVSWDAGITGENQIFPVTDPAFYFLPYELSVGSLRSGSVPIPSLSCVVKVVAFLHQLKDEQGRFASWDQVKPIVAPWLLSLPWDAVPPAQQPPVKLMREYVPSTNTVANSALTIFDAINNAGPSEPTPAERARIWNDYCNSTRQFRFYGGQEEAWVFSSLLADAFSRDALGVAKVEIYKHQDVVRPTPASSATQPMKIIVPVVTGSLPVDKARLITVVYNSAHYDSIINASLNLQANFAKVERDMNFAPEAMDLYFVQKVNLGNQMSEWQIIHQN